MKKTKTETKIETKTETETKVQVNVRIGENLYKRLVLVALSNGIKPSQEAAKIISEYLEAIDITDIVQSLT